MVAPTFKDLINRCNKGVLNIFERKCKINYLMFGWRFNNHDPYNEPLLMMRTFWFATPCLQPLIQCSKFEVVMVFQSLTEMILLRYCVNIPMDGAVEKEKR